MYHHLMNFHRNWKKKRKDNIFQEYLQMDEILSEFTGGKLRGYIKKCNNKFMIIITYHTKNNVKK